MKRFLPGRWDKLAASLLPGFCLTAFILSCNVTERDLGGAPIGPSESSAGVDTSSWRRDSISANMRIFASPQTLKAGNQAHSTVTVQVFDQNHNPLRGKLVRFAASLGTISAQDTTDDEGAATAVYSGLPRNAEVNILAFTQIADTTAVVGTSVQLEGVTLAIAPLSPDTLVGSLVPLTLTLKDGEGEPIAAVPVKLQGAVSSDAVTDGAGVVRTSVKSDKEAQVKVTASAQGAAASVTVGFWTTPPDSRSRTLLLSAEPSRLSAANGETSKIKAILYDDNHNPVAGKRVAFATTHGLITPSDTTGADGVAEAEFQGVAQNADALITASYQQGDSTRRATATVTLAGLQIEVKPFSGEALLTDTVPISIRVRDAKGRAMPDVQVSIKGALQTSLRTNASGAVTATVASASERLVQVKASALGASDSAKVNFLVKLPIGSVLSAAAIGNMRIFVDRSQLKASNTDETKVRVVAFDKFNNPLAGRPVRFTANYGIVTNLDTTDARGEAEAVYRAVPLNTDARVTATMSVEDSSLAVFTTITLAGLEIDVQPTLTNALLNRSVPVLIKIIDGAGSPVPNATVIFNGNPGQGTTDGEGIFRTAVTSGTQKRITVSAQALGAQDSNFVDFWTVLPTKNPNTVETIRNMRIFSSRSQVRADNSDFAVISVILTNENNNPATGDVVKFTSNLGIIGQSATVDSAGRANVILHGVPINGICKVTATVAGRNLEASTEIIFSGVTLALSTNQTELKVGELASLEATLRDASGNAIGGDDVTFTLSGPGTFDNGNPTYTTVLRPDGKALVRVSARGAGTVVAKAAALNTTDSLTLRFNTNSLNLTASSPTIKVGGVESATITATYLKGDGSPDANKLIRFATNAGSVSPDSAQTDANGKAVTTLKSALFSGTATVQANAPGGSAKIQVTYSALAPWKIKLSVTADNIGVNGGQALVRAVVTDTQGNLVTGQNVNFRILKGPGGGEAIVTPLVMTQAGIAVTQLQAGAVVSSYRGVLIEASFGTKALEKDSAKLTISGPAHIVTVARPEDDTVKVQEGGSRDKAFFESFTGALVQDINGNMVADGTEVHFSAVITGLAIEQRVFDRWDGLVGFDTSVSSVTIVGSVESVRPIYHTVLADILPFEDINNNLRLDPGIDLDLDGIPSMLRRGEDRNGDGRFDYDPLVHDVWFDFNHNGKCDTGVGEKFVMVNGVEVLFDQNADGIRNPGEIIVDRGRIGVCDLPMDSSGTVMDYPYVQWDTRDYIPKTAFRENDNAVAIEVSAVTKNGEAHAIIRYPRQFANRFAVTINAEANGIRDKDGERFLLRQIKD
ncbi:MAG: invasin domain 3-containing protein [Fibrobacteria bacterium]